MDTVRKFLHPSGRTFALGRKRPLVVGPHLRLGNYMLRKMPTPPATVSYVPAAKQWLAQVLGNDTIGDCTLAAAFHISGMMLQNAGQPVDPAYTVSNILKLYYQLTGGPDSGLDEQVVFNWWQAHGLLSDNVNHRIVARVVVDPTDQEQVQVALWLFENLYLTAELPDAWANNMPSADGFTWDVAGASDPDDGHAFCAVSYDAAGPDIDTWGLIGKLTWAALKQYCCSSRGGGCYAVISQDAVNKGTQKAPNGFDWSQLQADIASFHT